MARVTVQQCRLDAPWRVADNLEPARAVDRAVNHRQSCQFCRELDLERFRERRIGAMKSTE